MALTRNQRRKLRRERMKAKALRLYYKEKAKQSIAVAEIVKRNLSSPRPERNYYAGISDSVTRCAERGSNRQCSNLSRPSGMNDREIGALKKRLDNR